MKHDNMLDFCEAVRTLFPDDYDKGSAIINIGTKLLDDHACYVLGLTTTMQCMASGLGFSVEIDLVPDEDHKLAASFDKETSTIHVYLWDRKPFVKDAVKFFAAAMSKFINDPDESEIYFIEVYRKYLGILPEIDHLMFPKRAAFDFTAEGDK